MQWFQFVFPNALGLEQWFSLPSMPLGRHLKTDSQALPQYVYFTEEGICTSNKFPRSNAMAGPKTLVSSLGLTTWLLITVTFWESR